MKSRIIVISLAICLIFSMGIYASSFNNKKDNHKFSIPTYTTTNEIENNNFSVKGLGQKIK